MKKIILGYNSKNMSYYIIIRGPLGSGKSTISKKLARILGAKCVHVDGILEKHGLVVVGVKHKGGFDVDIPLKMRVKSGSSILVLGTPAAIMAAERKGKQQK